MPRYRQSPSNPFVRIWQALRTRASLLDTSLSPSVTLKRLRAHQWQRSDLIYVLHVVNAFFWTALMQTPQFPFKLLIPAVWVIALLVPFTSQFFLPATPVLSWLITYYSSRYIPVEWRPAVSVTTLPTLESVLYGGNISDFLTRYTHPILDVVAWLSYGVLHFVLPAVVAIFLWLFAPKRALHYWAAAFGYLNLCGVIIQDVFPCTPPCAFTSCAYARLVVDTFALSRVRNHLRSHTRRIWHSGFRRWPRTDRRNLWCSSLPKGLRRRTSPIRRIPLSPLCLCYARGPVCWTFLPPPSQNCLGICRNSLLGDHVPYASLSH